MTRRSWPEIGAASQLTGLPAEALLREYGRYFIMNGLTSHLCTYVLSQISSGRVCPVLWGAIEEAAECYRERVQIVEQSCMKREATICRFEATFSAPAWDPNRYRETPEQLAHQVAQKRLADFIWTFCPPRRGHLVSR
jgi:hypothetical protein